MYFYAASFRRLGHDVTIFDHTPMLGLRSFPGRVRGALKKIIFPTEARTINAAMSAVLRVGYDLIVVNKGLHVSLRTIRLARRGSGSIVNINQDDYFGSDSGALHIWSPYLNETFPEYDAVFTPRLHRMSAYLQRGARAVHHLPFAFDPTMHHPVTLSDAERDAWCSDIAFVGTWSRKRESVLSALPEQYRIRIWGASWWRASLSFLRRRTIQTLGPLPCESIPKVVAGMKIGINMYTEENYDDYSLRTFEVPACGGFQLAEQSVTANKYFEADREAVYFRDKEELARKVEFYMDHDSDRMRIAQAGHERAILSGYDYDSRAREMLGALRLKEVA